MPKVILLGPQRLAPTLVDAVNDLGIDGPIAMITAGWEEREEEDTELKQHLDKPTVNLRVFGRVEEIYKSDTELHGATLERQETIRKLRDLYRLRLGHALQAARELLRWNNGDRALAETDCDAAIKAVRDLDAHHKERISQVHTAFEATWKPAKRPAVARHRKEIQKLLKGAAALGVAGGHVNRLLNRMRLLGLPDLAKNLPVLAWSAGAMALSQQIVLFHDSPPQGAGDAEVLEAGLGLYSGVIPLPDARRRLRLDDATRVALFARRFGQDICALMDEGARLDWDGARWTAHEGTYRLAEDGSQCDAT